LKSATPATGFFWGEERKFSACQFTGQELFGREIQRPQFFLANIQSGRKINSFELSSSPILL
jgi:hypothetical protein